MKVEAEDVPPPGAGFITVTFTGPAVATSLAGIAAKSLAVLMKVVGSALPLKFTTDFATKCAPFTISVKATPPAMWVLSRLDTAGIGLFELLLIVRT